MIYTYQGRPCPRCEGTKRYTKTNSCVVCHRQQRSRWAERSRRNPVPGVSTARLHLRGETRKVVLGIAAHWDERRAG